MRRGLLLPLLLAVLTLGWVGAAQPGTAVAAATCDGVWVVVDFGSLGGSSTECATSYGTGAAALRSASFSPTLDNGMVTRIAGKPSSPDLNKAYWSYWHATARADGSYSGWSYSTLGATGYHPKAGNAEGWRYQGLNDGKVPPAASPPKAPAPTPTPTPTKATPKPTSKPTPSATRKATPKPSASASPTRAASATAPASPTPKASTAPPTPTPAAVVSADTASGPPASSLSRSDGGGGQGSPVGAVAVGAAVVAGGAGLGGWWLLKGRRR